MPDRPRIPHLRVGLAAAALSALCACAGSSEYALPDDFARSASAAEETSPLGGEALAKRKQDLLRAHADMAHFHATLGSLRHRRDRSGFNLFGQFLDAYMGLHLDPLLQSEWQSKHPEVMALDANLRFAKADVLIRMRATRRVQEVIEEIGQRFEGRGSMLVEYPIGEQSTLQAALKLLEDGKWRG